MTTRSTKATNNYVIIKMVNSNGIFALVLMLLGFIGNSAGQMPKYKLNNLRPLTAEGTHYSYYCWSPDNKTIAMIGGKHRGLYVVNIDSPETLRRVADKIIGSCIAWSPDGKEVAFMQYAGDTVIKGKQATPGNIKRLSPNIPDSESIAWKARKETINVVNLKTGKIREIDRGVAMFSNIKWAQDGILRVKESGEKIKTRHYDKYGNKYYDKTKPFLITTKDKNSNIYISNDDGTNMRKLTTEGRYIEASLSPDNKKILTSNNGLIIIDVATGTQKRIGNFREETAYWVPDSKHLLFPVAETGGHDGGSFVSSDIYIIDEDGANQTRLTFNPELILMEPVFSPDGKSIVMVSLKGKRMYIAGLEIYER